MDKSVSKGLNSMYTLGYQHGYEMALADVKLKLIELSITALEKKNA